MSGLVCVVTIKALNLYFIHGMIFMLRCKHLQAS